VKIEAFIAEVNAPVPISTSASTTTRTTLTTLTTALAAAASPAARVSWDVDLLVTGVRGREVTIEWSVVARTAPVVIVVSIASIASTTRSTA
tara:strand:+ start:1343 stop:1618 length:276 start_codon:yes stop_codon:yes gene_type:complete